MDSNQELTMPHTATLPIELHLPKNIFKFILFIFEEAIRTPKLEHQKFMTLPIRLLRIYINMRFV